MSYKFKDGAKVKSVFQTNWDTTCVDCGVDIYKGEYVVYDGQTHCGCQETA